MRRPCPHPRPAKPGRTLFVIAHVRDPKKHYIPGQTRMSGHGAREVIPARSVHYLGESQAPGRTRL